MRGVVRHYANIVHLSYVEALRGAKSLESVLKAFVADPTDASFAAAKAEWIESRRPYLQTEAFRFYAGPIDDEDGPEPMINGWPMDEYHIDYIDGAPLGGLINAPDDYPDITKELIASLNEKAGETAITSGYHAIEFLLWGQDWNDGGPGDRPVTDYTTAANANRRGAYLLACADLLTDHLTDLVAEWAPDQSDNYRAEFIAADPAKSVRAIVYGLHALSGKELAGERLLVAWDTQDQEDEHSCFSDTTHLDAYYDAIGIQNVYRGTYRPESGEPISGTGVRALVRTFLPGEVADFDGKIVEIIERLKAIPQPFDQAIIGDDETPSRQVILAAVESLEDFAAMMSHLDHAVLALEKE